MTTVTPIYSNGTWGDVVAVDKDGVIITPETEGAVIHEDRETVYEKDGCLPVTVINKVFFQAIKPWDVLEAQNLIPDLTPIPEPDEVRQEREARERRATRLVAPYDFQDRFTDAELVAIQTSTDPIVIRGRTKIQTITTHIDLDHSETQQLIQYLASVGVIQPSRVKEILV